MSPLLHSRCFVVPLCEHRWLGDNTVLLATSISTLFLVSVLWMTNRLAVSLTPERVANQLYTSNTYAASLSQRGR